LRLIDQTDIALDAFPMNGHTTTCDCLWQGVPVVMLAGDTYVSRYGGSALVNLGLQDWIAHDPSEYVETARRWATDLPRLADLRAGLRARMAASPILDAAGFTRHLEAAYRRMWQAWCSQPG
jgi:predicted O-linked N-acetylglucosamine transferase (SPINDLY family)